MLLAVLALAALLYHHSGAAAPPAPPAPTETARPRPSPVASASPSPSDETDHPALKALLKRASQEGEVLAYVLVAEKKDFYAATLTMPDESPGLKQTELWRAGPDLKWIQGEQGGATIGPPPDPREFPQEWFAAAHFPAGARKKISASEWTDAP